MIAVIDFAGNGFWTFHFTKMEDFDDEEGVASINFGQHIALTSDTVYFNVINLGDDELVFDASVSTEVFSLGEASASIEAYGDHTMYAVFSPLETGVYTDDITFTTNDPNQATVLVALSGEGLTPPEIGISPESLSFSLVTGEEEKNQVVAISNSGGVDLLFQLNKLPVFVDEEGKMNLMGCTLVNLIMRIGMMKRVKIVSPMMSGLPVQINRDFLMLLLKIGMIKA